MLTNVDVVEIGRSFRKQAFSKIDDVLSLSEIEHDVADDLFRNIYELVPPLTYEHCSVEVQFDVECLKRTVREAMVDSFNDDVQDDLRSHVEAFREKLERDFQIYVLASNFQYEHVYMEDAALHV